MRAVWVAFLMCVALTVRPAYAAFVVPPIEGHVTDTAGLLSASDRADLEQRLTRDMTDAGAEIAVLIIRSLEGETVEDVAYKTFNTWRVGRDKLDNGVLLVIALTEHRIRIETGKGVGGAITDLQASDIIEHRIAPQLRAGHYRDAVADGTDAIVAAVTNRSAPAPEPPPLTLPVPVVVGIVALLLVFVFLRVRFGGGAPFWFWGPPSGGGMGDRGGGGSYSGGGGRSGGGGASGGW
jgi:uncharacterized protein